MNHSVKNAIEITDLNAQYDAYAKALLSNKIILAHILKETITEFKDMKAEDIVPLIEGEPYVANVSVEPGETNLVMNQAGSNITGLNGESTEPGEGKVYFDIIFYVRMQDGISQMIVNIEAQKDVPSGYDVINRAIYYSCRMISSQKERNFTNSEYNHIIPTYFIWICFNLNENCLNYLHLINTPLMGNHYWKGNLDLINIILVGLDKKLTRHAINETESDLHYLLGTLFSKKLKVQEKLELLDRRFQIQSDKKIREELDTMCNLSYGILEEGVEKGREEERKAIICEMLRDHQSYEQIRKYTNASVDEIKHIEETLK